MIITYQKTVQETVNNRRNYVQSQMKTSALAWASKNKGTLPSEALLLKCAMRDVSALALFFVFAQVC